MDTLISIIVPTCNRGYIIWKTIQGIVQQSYPLWELLIVDDGSIDNTEQVIAQFQDDLRIKYFKVPHKGSQFARNIGLQQAKGEIITYVDSDDFVYKNFLSTALEFFEKNPQKYFATSDFNRRLELYDKNFHLVESTDSSALQKQNITIEDFYNWEVKTCGTGIFHRNTIKEKGLKWDITIKRFQDWDFILQLSETYPEGYMFIPFILFEYHQRYGVDGICSSSTYKDWAIGFEDLYKKYKNNPLMKNQTWYPSKVQKYLKLQELADKNQISPVIYEGLKMLRLQESQLTKTSNS
ncbi:MAG: glycosyltransferase [bacterium]